MELQLTLGHLITLALALAGAVAALIKLLLTQQLRHIDRAFEGQSDRLSAIERAGKEDAGNWARVERELMALKQELPVNYVRRDDYIRGQSVIEAKLDALASQVQNVQLRALLHRPPSHPGEPS